MRERLLRAGAPAGRRAEAEAAPKTEHEAARTAPSKRTRTEAAEWQLADPGKLTRTAARTDQANPAPALEVARWLLAPERGWQPVQRRAESDESLEQGALASAFAFLAEGAASPLRLPAALAQRLSTNLGLDATQIRVHTDARAAAAAALLRARAFTVGADIYFAAGAYDPDSEPGIELIAHEVAHVAQHLRGVAASTSPSVSRPGEGHELEADELARRFIEGLRREPHDETRRLEATASEASAALWGAPVQRREGVSRSTQSTPPKAVPPHAEANAAHVARKATRGTSGGTSKPAAAALPVVVDLLGKADFEPTPELATHLEKAGAAGADVRVRLGSMSSVSLLRVKKVGRRYVTVEDRPQVVPISHSLFVPAPGLSPVVRVRIGAGGSGSGITGYLASAAAPESKGGLARSIGDNPSSIGLRGFELPNASLENELSGGTLTFGTKRPVRFELGGWVQGDLSFGLSNRNVTFEATANLHARGLRDAELRLSRDGKGNVVGSVRLAVDLGDKFTGAATATYRDGDIAISGELSYASEKFRGKLGIMVADVAAAEQMVRAQLDPLGVQPVAGVGGAGGAKPAANSRGKKGERGIAGWGSLDFAFTDWLVGKAQVVYGPTGHLTVVGKIAPPQRLDLMKTPKGIKKPIVPETRIEASYGLPYIADVHVGIGVSLSANAELGPITMTDLGIEGVYSTDPTVMNAFSITGALRAQAQAGLSLDVKGYAGLRILKHSVNFGAAVKGDAGIKAYAEARPTLGYREVASPTAGKQGEYYLKGHLEMAAQPVLALGGRLFIELDSPWWSPAPDKTWEWPLGKLEYPLPTQLGIGADIDYVVGSGQWPDVKLTQPSFNPGKFVDTLMDDKLPARGGRAGTQQKQGQWQGVAPTKPTAAPPTVAKKPAAEPKAETSASTGKPKKGKQTPEEKKSVPQSQDVAARWNAGMESLGELRKRSEKDPETQAEIQQHLGELKARHGFTKLSADRSGDVWLVDAAMNPEKKDIPIKADPKEGKAGEGAKEGDGKDHGKKKLPLQLPFALHGEAHTLFVEDGGANLAVSMASRKERLAGKYQRFQQTVAEYVQRFRTLPEPAVAELLQDEVARLQRMHEGQLAAALAKLEGISSKQFGELEAQVSADADRLVAEIVATCGSFQLPDLTPEALRQRAEEAEEKAWEEAVQGKRREIQERLQEFVPQLRALAQAMRSELPEEEAPAANAVVELKYRGSAAKGRKGRHKGFARFDPEDFDLDAFVESDVLVAVAQKRTRQEASEFWANKTVIPELMAVEQAMSSRLRTLTGLREEGGFSLKLRSSGNVREVLANKKQEGERHVTISPPPENRL